MDIIQNFLSKYLVIPQISVIDLIEMLIIAFAIYQILKWVKDKRAGTLLKGLGFVLCFSFVAVILHMEVILWIFKNFLSVGIMAIVVVFHPELRSALDQLGRKNVKDVIFGTTETGILTSDSIRSIVKACSEMSMEKTGALIVIENKIMLNEEERTGIVLNANISSSLLLNIFEHNTPLHDGAVVIRDNKIYLAACILPVSTNLNIDKRFGTRHRAAVGISEVSDCIAIVVSEETGKISLVSDGVINSGLMVSELMNRLNIFAEKDDEAKRSRFRRRKGDKTENEENNQKNI